jgi:pSer/pThr/pTyr-binding forkhead associated (FHA) protein
MSGIILLGLRTLAAVSLYAFLGWALFLLWKSLRQDALEIASRQVKPLSLLVVLPDETEPVLLHFTSNDVAIGREMDCECQLQHGTVSARHARLMYHHNQWWLDDLQSTNGTKLNDELVQTPTIVVNGDTIKCGEAILTVILKTETQPGSGD